MAQDADIQRPLGNSIAHGGNDSVGNHPIGVPVTFTYTTENVGDANLEVANKAVSYDNVVGCLVGDNPNFGPLTILPAGTEEFGVEVTPLDPSWSFDILVNTDDPDEDPYTIHVIGASGSATGQRLFGANIFGGESDPSLM